MATIGSCLNVWFPFGGLFRLMRCGFVGIGVSLGVGLELSKAQARSSPLSPAVDQM